MSELADRPTSLRRAATGGPTAVLTAAEFDVVWEALGLGPTPVVLQLTSPGRTHTERRRIVAGAWDAVRARGPAWQSDVEQLLRLLARPSARVELRAWGRTPVRAVAAVGPDGTGMLARRRDGGVALERCTSLPSAVVGLLPPAAPGPGRAAVVPTAALAAAGARPSGAGLRADLIDHGAAPEEAGPVARMLFGVDGRAQIGVLRGDDGGMLRRLPDVLEILDGPRGRYCTIRSADGWTTVAPTDARRLRHRVAELLAACQSRSPCRMSWRPDSVIEPDMDG